MLAVSERPKRFSDMRGADIPRKILRSICSSPKNSPKSLILQGAWGSGKTTSARIFSMAVNCKSHSGDACLKCESCRGILEGSSKVVELDSAMTGNVRTLKDISESLMYATVDGFRVVILDEFHLTPAQAQSVLLKMLEDVNQSVFFLFCTTDAHKIISPIRSRSLEIIFDTLSKQDISCLLHEIAGRNNIVIDDELVDIIFSRSKGHARDAVLALEMSSIVGVDSYKSDNQLLLGSFASFLSAAGSGDVEGAKSCLREILKNTKDVISTDFSFLISELCDSVFLGGKGSDYEKNVLLSYLRNKRFLDSHDAWSIWLSSLVRSGGSSSGSKSVMSSRFSR